MNKNMRVRRVVIMIFIFLIILLFFSYQLMQLQVVMGDEYEADLNQGATTRVRVEAVRGEILDANGTPLVQNRTGYTVIFDYSMMDKSRINEIILKTSEILSENGEEWMDSLPISMEQPFTFIEGEESAVSKLKTSLGRQQWATADDVLYAMTVTYKISEEYTSEQIRVIAGVRYNMEQKGFNSKTLYTFAEDVSFDTTIKIRENRITMQGVDTGEKAYRQYLSGTMAPHIIGQVGPLYREEYEELAEKGLTDEENGYLLNDVIGKSGVEGALEDYLRGSNGWRYVELDKDGNPIGEPVTESPIPGNTIVLTIDSDLQNMVQDSLANRILYLQENAEPGEGQEADAGSVVVLEVSTGKVLAAATYPSYNIGDYRSNYSELLNTDGNPLFNRALMGLYAPGSCFKPMVSVAGLAEGVITPTSTRTCERVYTRLAGADLSGYSPTCMGYHGHLSVVDALKVSCNIFYYDSGYDLGIDLLDQYSALFGFGEDTGLELPNLKGVRSNPAAAEAMGETWVRGDVIQTAIGQSRNQFTPLQIANYCATIARRGVLLKTKIVDSIISYNGDEVIQAFEPEVISTIPDAGDVFDTVIQGMVAASTASGGTARDYFGNYPITVASKTGTPQTSGVSENSVFICFAPAEDPQIAIAVVIEHGSHGYMGAPVAKEILNYYFGF